MDTTLTSLGRESERPRSEEDERLALVVLWSRDEPERVGELAMVPPDGRRVILGRAGRESGSSTSVLALTRLRPSEQPSTGPLRSRRISREQLELRATPRGTLALDNRGRCPLRIGGREVKSAEVSPGALFELHRTLLMMCVRRPSDGASFARSCNYPRREGEPLPGPHPFGRADPQGLVGESPAAWQLRGLLRFVAGRQVHVLIRGASGTGKELAAQAIHALSNRAAHPLVARNAATLPETLIDAELFGNARNYPNPGMPARRGLVGEADGSTLFLDEFAELPESSQVHLLRVLDEGEYTSLGEARARRADLRLVAATNRPLDRLKHDLRARLKIQLELPGLTARREDVPLLAAHLLRRLCRDDDQLARRCFPEGDTDAAPRLSASLVETLVLYPYTTHLRELEGLLWQALLARHGDDDAPLILASGPPTGAPTSPPVAEDHAPPDAEDEHPDHDPAAAIDPNQLTPAQIQACLDRHGGRQEPAWRELGLSSRHVLTRLIRRYGLRVRGRQRDRS